MSLTADGEKNFFLSREENFSSQGGDFSSQGRKLFLSGKETFPLRGGNFSSLMNFEEETYRAFLSVALSLKLEGFKLKFESH